MAKQKNAKNANSKEKSRVGILAALGVLVVVLAGFAVYLSSLNNNQADAADLDSSAASAKGLTISVDELSTTPTFYPYKAGNMKMEIIALKASDGTYRTAYNTCQVCNNSGKGYYKLEGDTLVCQNCGNRFKPDQVEKEKGGCNPVPILDDSKTESDGKIVISVNTLQEASSLFKTWKR